MNLEELRKEIRKVDVKILSLLAERNELSKAIGAFKKEKDMKIKDEKYEDKLIDELISIGKGKNVSPELIENIFREIISNSRKIQEENISK